MSAIRSVAIVPFPLDRVVFGMRDDLALLAPRLDDIAAIVPIERVDMPDGGLRVVNRWETSVPVPGPVARYASRETICWYDHARWTPDARCSWKIELDFLADRIACDGETVFTEAMSGRGTRIAFSGTLSADLRGLVGPGADTIAGRLVEFFAGGIVPRNFQRVARALTERLRSLA